MRVIGIYEQLQNALRFKVNFMLTGEKLRKRESELFSQESMAGDGMGGFVLADLIFAERDF